MSTVDPDDDENRTTVVEQDGPILLEINALVDESRSAGLGMMRPRATLSQLARRRSWWNIWGARGARGIPESREDNCGHGASENWNLGFRGLHCHNGTRRPGT